MRIRKGGDIVIVIVINIVIVVVDVTDVVSHTCNQPNWSMWNPMYEVSSF